MDYRKPKTPNKINRYTVIAPNLLQILVKAINVNFQGTSSINLELNSPTKRKSQSNLSSKENNQSPDFKHHKKVEKIPKDKLLQDIQNDNLTKKLALLKQERSYKSRKTPKRLYHTLKHQSIIQRKKTLSNKKNILVANSHKP